MRKLILKMSVSLDGFVSGPNGEADWIQRTGGPDTLDRLVQELRQAGVHIMGSMSYHAMASFYPTATVPFAPPMNEIPKVVFTQKGLELPSARAASEPEGSWGNPRIADGDLVDEVNRLKAEPGQAIMAHGGVAFAHSLIRQGLVDEYWLTLRPVALGAGLPLFPEGYDPRYLECISADTFERGATAIVYRPA